MCTCLGIELARWSLGPRPRIVERAEVRRFAQRGLSVAGEQASLRSASCIHFIYYACMEKCILQYFVLYTIFYIVVLIPLSVSC